MGNEGRVIQKKAGVQIQAFFIVLLVLLFGHLWGQEETLKVPGKLVIDTAGRYNHINGIITITAKGIEIESEKKIFQPYNDFDAPRSDKLFIDIRKLTYVGIRQNDDTFQIHLHTTEEFYFRYRNLFLEYEVGIVSHLGEEKMLVFLIEKSTGFDAQCFKKLIHPVSTKVYEPF